jgi:hypothetical protein
VAAKFEPEDEEAYRRIRLINMHYQVSLEQLGERQLMMTEALTYSNMYRPSRSKITAKGEKIDIEVVQGLIQNNTYVSSQSYISMGKSFGELPQTFNQADAKTMDSEYDTPNPLS